MFPISHLLLVTRYDEFQLLLSRDLLIRSSALRRNPSLEARFTSVRRIPKLTQTSIPTVRAIFSPLDPLLLDAESLDLICRRPPS